MCRLRTGAYRINKIYSGENWNPELRAPLSAPGIRVAEGDYILEVNGKARSRQPSNFYSLFEGTGGPADGDSHQQLTVSGRFTTCDRNTGCE
jgi:hypothetical protein